MTTGFLFYAVLKSHGATPVLKYSIISTKYSLATCTENNCASGKLSSKLVGYSPLVTLDR
jgi:hypothetical protein